MKHKIIFYQFFCMLILPVLTFPFAKNFIDTKNHENRQFAEKPQLSIQTLTSFPEQFENYFNDYLPYKNQLVMLNTMKEDALGVGSTVLEYRTMSPVIRGKEDWLFYNAFSEEEHSFDDYMCNNLYEEAELEKIADGYVKLQKELEKNGTELVVLYVTNKEQIYPEYMPSDIVPESSYSRNEQLIDYMREKTDIPLLYTKDALLEQKDKHRLFYKYDTHWNALGGFVGTQVLNKYLQEECVSLDNVTYSAADKAKVKDLAEMLAMGNVYTDDVEWQIEDYKKDVTVEIVEHIPEIEKFKFVSSAKDDRSVLVMMDSFGRYMMDYMIRDYKQVTCLINVNEQKVLSEFKKCYESEYPDIVVLEILERRSAWQENVGDVLYQELTGGSSIGNEVQ
ncbi:MAG: hypothetical protein J6A75_10340 [Lachnospiraceae bacterium]|nr:hypothetical protein [Lachnospiraceae bacterium]